MAPDAWKSGNPRVKGGYLAKATQMTRLLAVLRIEIGLHQIPGHAGTDRPSSHAENVHVIVLDPLLCGNMIMDQAGAHSLGLVRTDRSPDPASADRDATLDLPGHDGSGKRGHVIGIIVVGSEVMGPEIDHLVAGGLQFGNQLLLEFKAAMVRGKSYAHGVQSSFPRPQDKGEGFRLEDKGGALDRARRGDSAAYIEVDLGEPLLSPLPSELLAKEYQLEPPRF